MEAGPEPAPVETGSVQTGRPRRWLKLAWDVLFTVLAVLVVSAALIYTGLQFFGYRFYEVTSTSMVPTFGQGDVVAMKAVPAHEIAVRDIIVYQREGYPAPIVHRVTRIQSSPDIHSVIRDKSGKVLADSWAYSLRTFWAQGDANNVEDSKPISESQVLGTERFVVPPPLNLIVTKINRTLLIWLAAAAIALFAALGVLDLAKALARRRRIRRSNVAPTEMHDQ